MGLIIACRVMVGLIFLLPKLHLRAEYLHVSIKGIVNCFSIYIMEVCSKVNVSLKHKPGQKEIEVLIEYPVMNPTVKRLESLVRSIDKSIKCSSDEHEVWILVSDIYYVESVDKKTYVYTENADYQSELRLYQIFSELSDYGFVQVSKACLLNLRVLTGIKPLLNSRLEAILTNGEKICITRKYIPGIREKLKER